jgi:hypothetical protein
MSSDVLFSRGMTVKWGNIFPSGVTCHIDICRVVGCIQLTQCWARVNCDWKITEYKHEGYCDMPLTLSTCKSRAGTAVREYALRYPGRPHTDTNALQWLEQRLRETGGVTITAHVNTVAQALYGHQPKKMQKLQLWKPTDCLQSTSWRFTAPLPLLAEYISLSRLLFFTMQFCRFLRHQHTAYEQMSCSYITLYGQTKHIYKRGCFRCSK